MRDTWLPMVVGLTIQAMVCMALLASLAAGVMLAESASLIECINSF